MNCKTANNLDLVTVITKFGFAPQYYRGTDAWCNSPLRNENVPSMKICTVKNVWYDHGAGIGGTVVDLVRVIKSCSTKEALENLRDYSFSFHQQKKQIRSETIPTYSIKKVTELTNQKLLDYLSKRKINLQFAKRFCFQVHYSFSNGNENYAIGFMNDIGGFEIRNKLFKGCLGKKEITTINNNSDVVSIFESWSDFLSYLTLKKEMPEENFIILNSTSLVKKTIDLLEDYTVIKLFFDRDTSGSKATDFLIKNANSKIIDNRIHYKNFNDLNDYLMKQN